MMSAEASTSSTRATEILVLHPAALDPTAYLSRLAWGDQQAPGNSPDHGGGSDTLDLSIGRIPWTIDNKYYTAQVTFCQTPQEAFDASTQEQGAVGYQVVMYLFSDRLHSLPSALVRIMAEPRDIALAVRIPSGQEVTEEQDRDELEDMFGELGVEFLDDSGSGDMVGNDDDDERPMQILDQVRQTLMTHMWPNMVRKPLSAGSRGIDEPFPDDVDGDVDIDGPESSTAFPTSFTHDPTAEPTGAEPSRQKDTAATFPGLDELRSQIMLQDTERMEEAGFSRLDMMDNDEWVQAEYSRLDEWLDEDDGQTLEDGNEHIDAGGSRHSPADPDREHQVFEDDFADFAPFQSGPQPSSQPLAAENLPLDPTPLLLHLQNVREELAGLDEDTRRARAGKEVETLLRSLGMGGLDWDEEDEFTDLDNGGGLQALGQMSGGANTK